MDQISVKGDEYTTERLCGLLEGLMNDGLGDAKLMERIETDKQFERLFTSIAMAGTAEDLGYVTDALCIEGLLPNGATKSLLVGPSSVGKTFLALEIARCIAEARDMAGLHVHPSERGVLYLAAEDHHGVMCRLGAQRSVGHIGPDTPIMVANLARYSLTRPDDVGRIIETIEVLRRAPMHFHLGAFVIDHLTACAGESLDGDAAAERVMDALQRIADTCYAPVLALHHTGKDQSRGARGSQVLYDRADAVVQVREARGDLRRMFVDKLRNGAKAADRWFRIVPITGTETSGARVEFVSEPEGAAERPMTERQSAALLALQEASDFDGISDGAAKAAIRAHPLFAGLIGDAQRKAIQRALDDLAALGKLKLEADMWCAA